ncbi:hypothetical protein [Allorhizobium sonneratiae]|uniref:hypothetical protein n=1 Tax=Allorhizobium sonneratiae TaxID=2934936 RepID=UPI0030846722
MRPLLTLGLSAGLALLSAAVPSYALSSVQGTTEMAQSTPADPSPAPAAPAKTATAPSSAPAPAPSSVEISYDISKAPEPVRAMREKIVEAAASGDPERLRPLLTGGKTPTTLSLGGDNSDPIATIKSVSGDPDGLEVMAIMLDVLSTGYARINAGTPDETYVWPYFAEKPINTLTAPEKVDLLRLVTAGDYENMLDIGNYNFFRIGIAPDGSWKFLAAGD